MLARRCLPALATLALICACSQGTPTAFTPQFPSTGGDVLAQLVITVPRQHRHRGVSPKYISPATASLTYAVDGGKAVSVALSSSNPHCTGAVSLQCTVPLSVKPGTHTLSLETFDAGHNLLSGNTDVATNIKRGKANNIAVTLGGIVKSIAIFGPNAPEVTGNQNQGFVLYGNTPVTFSVVPVDVDGNFIIGAGAPHVKLSPAPTDVTIGAPPASSTNRWTLHSTYSASNPTIAKTTGITAVSTPVPHSGGTIVTVAVPLTLYQPWLYVTRGDGSVAVYDELGHAISPAGTWANLSSGSGMAFAPNNGFIYIEDPGFNDVKAYDAAGNYQFTISTGVGNNAIVFDPNTLHLYVAIGNTVGVYTLSGSSVSTGGSWAGLDSPYGIAIDPATNHLYFTNNNSNAVTVYDEDGNPQALPGTPFANLSSPIGIAYDAHKGWFYIANAPVGGFITVYDANGAQQTTAGSFGNAQSAFGNGLVFDPYNRSLYVLTAGLTPSLTRYDENGRLIAPISIPPSPFPVGLLEVP